MYCPKCTAKLSTTNDDYSVCSECRVKISIQAVEPLDLNDLISLIKNNHYIASLKAIRGTTGMTLKEAKNLYVCLRGIIEHKTLTAENGFINLGASY